jgi:hypothetical protein
MNDLFALYVRRYPIERAQKGAQEDMSTQEILVQQFARLFHHYHEALSPEVEQESASLNSDHNRLVAAARSAILELETRALLHDDRRYFAKPGEAEWGC